MLRLPDLDRISNPSKTFAKLFLPHFGLVVMVAVYLLIGSQVFYYLEWKEDRRARFETKLDVNREIDSLLRRLSPTSSSPELLVDVPTLLARQQAVSGRHLNNKHKVLQRWHYLAKVVEGERKQTRESLYELLKRWEYAVRTYDMQAEEVRIDPLTFYTRTGDNVTEGQLEATNSRWTFNSALLFTFTVITTIGYGNLTPATMQGRLFCMFYGIVGIPLTMLAIANVGKFLSEGAELLVEKLRRELAYRRLKRRTFMAERCKSRLAGQFFQEVVQKADIQLRPLPASIGNLSVLLAFVFYIVFGAVFLPLWETLNFFDSCYFSFVTLTTVGFGDIVPRRYDYLIPTLIYISIGLAITTLNIQLFGEALRKVHYIGSRIKDAKNAFIWFGNKMLTVGELVTAVGKQYGIPQLEIETLNFNLDQVIEQTVEAKEHERRLGAPTGLEATANAVVFNDVRSTTSQPLFCDSEFRYIDEDSLVSTPLKKDVVCFAPGF